MASITAKVKKKKMSDVATANMGPVGSVLSAQEPKFGAPTLAQQTQMREMVTAKMQANSAVPSANMMAPVAAPSARIQEEVAPNIKSKVKSKSSVNADVYDERIGGYGKSMGPQESGEAAVQRIMKSKVKRKKVM
jgi:hypothetical protein